MRCLSGCPLGTDRRHENFAENLQLPLSCRTHPSFCIILVDLAFLCVLLIMSGFNLPAMRSVARCLWLLLLASLTPTTVHSAAARLRLTRERGVTGMTSVTVDRAGVWGVGADGALYVRPGTPGSPIRSSGSDGGKSGQGWVKVPLGGEDADVAVRQADAGGHWLWAVKDNQRIYYLANVTTQLAAGATLGRLGDGRLQQVSVSPGGSVWGVNQQGAVYIRHGVSECSPLGDDWTRVGSEGEGLTFSQVSAGFAGVWAVTVDNQVYFRNGTFGDYGLQGSSWTKVEGQVMSSVVSGDGYALGVGAAHGAPDGSLHIRCQVSTEYPTGLGWLKVNAKVVSGEKEGEGVASLGTPPWGGGVVTRAVPGERALYLKEREARPDPVRHSDSSTIGYRSAGDDKEADNGIRKKKRKGGKGKHGAEVKDSGKVKVGEQPHQQSLGAASLDTYSDHVWVVDALGDVFHGHLGEALAHCQTH